MREIDVTSIACGLDALVNKLECNASEIIELLPMLAPVPFHEALALSPLSPPTSLEIVEHNEHRKNVNGVEIINSGGQ